jgi:hypothetical protein
MKTLGKTLRHKRPEMFVVNVPPSGGLEPYACLGCLCSGCQEKENVTSLTSSQSDYKAAGNHN